MNPSAATRLKPHLPDVDAIDGRPPSPNKEHL
jgi:hypothetical protein